MLTRAERASVHEFRGHSLAMPAGNLAQCAILSFQGRHVVFMAPGRELDEAREVMFTSRFASRATEANVGTP
eukprot:11542806-Alexandrium_andersonii.AAC.1